MTLLRWAIYARISDDRREGERLGVERQEKDVRELIARIDPAGVIAGVYTDNDISAYSGKPRPEYRRLLADITSGTITAVGAWHTDRLHRSLAELEEYIDTCQPRGVPTHTAKAGVLDLATPAGRMTARILGAVARHESEHKAERIKSKHIELAAAGKATGGGYRPYGYRRIYDREERPHKIVREEIILEEAEIIRECARRILAGEGLYTVAADLNARGIPTSAGRQWSTSSLARILASARIAGMREHRPRGRDDTKRIRTGTITARGEWPAIITAAQSDQLRGLLTQADRRTSPGRTGRYLCAGGVLYCDLCKQRMSGRSTGKNRRTMYLCDGSPGRAGCGHCFIDGEGTDAVVSRWVAGAISSTAFRRALRQRGGAPDETILLAEIAAAEREMDEWAADKAAGLVTRSEWLAARASATARIRRARAQLSQENHVIILDGLPTALDALQAFLLDGEVPVARRRTVIHVVLEKVFVTPTKVVGRHRFDPSRLEPVWVR